MTRPALSSVEGGFALRLSKDQVERILTLLVARMARGGNAVEDTRALVALFDKIQQETGLSPSQTW